MSAGVWKTFIPSASSHHYRKGVDDIQSLVCKTIFSFCSMLQYCCLQIQTALSDRTGKLSHAMYFPSEEQAIVFLYFFSKLDDK